jgi:hypothetical protein
VAISHDHLKGIYMSSLSTSNDRLIPVADWSTYHPWPPKGGLRHLIFHRNKNGFDRVLVRIGRRLLIDEAAFFAWARSGNILSGGKQS